MSSLPGLPASLKLRRPQQSVPGEAFWRSRDPAIHRAKRIFKGWMRGSSPRMTSARVAAACATCYLPQRNREPAQVRVRHQAGLLAGELEHGTLLVGEHDGAGAVDDGKASAGRAVDAGDVGGAVDVADAATQDGFRAAEHEAVIDA